MEPLNEILEREVSIEPVAIPAEYRGVLFRSRLEARWAVFLDGIGVQWAYEYEGFALKDGRYLPDFWLPELSTWFEIKHAEPASDSRAVRMADQLCAVSGFRVALAAGGFATHEQEPCIEVWDCEEVRGDGGLFRFVFWDSGYGFCACPACGQVGIEYEFRSERVCGTRCFPTSDKGRNLPPRFKEAYEAARTRRFWK